MWRSRTGLGFGRVAASAALILTAFTSFGAALLVDATPAHALASCTDTWTGDAGDGLWTTAGNWLTSTSTEAVPISTDVVCIGNNSGSSISVALNSGATIAVLELGGGTKTATLTVTNANLTVGDTAGDASEVESNGILDLTSASGTAYLQEANASTNVSVASGGQLNLTAAASDTAYAGYVGSLTIDSGANLSATGPGTDELWNAVTTVNDGTITVNSGATLQADGDEFTNAGSIVDNGAFDADPTKFLVTTGSESGSTAAGVVLEGGTFEDSLSAGGGTYTTGGGITLGAADLPSPEVPGVPLGQTLDILNQNTSNNVTNFTDSGIVNVTSNGGTGYIQGVAATDGFTVASGGALNLTAAVSGETAYVGYQGSLTIDSGANLNATGPGTGELWNAVTTVNDGTITVNSGATLQADGDGFTNAGSIVDNGAFDADPTKFLVTTGSESGSTAAGVVLEGGLFEDSLSAGGGTYTTGGGITLSGVDLPSPEVPGVPLGQTLDIINQNTGNGVTNFTDSGVINVTANGGTGYIQDGAASDGLTVASGGALNLTAAATDTAYVGYVGSLTIDSGANLERDRPGHRRAVERRHDGERRDDHRELGCDVASRRR